MPKILVVDDSEVQRNEMRHALEAAGHTVVAGVDGQDGFEKYMANPDVDILIADVNMPKMDGITMCRKIKEQQRGKLPPVFMLSTEADLDMKERARDVGIVLWKHKPVAPEVLLTTIDKVLKRH